MTLDFPHVRSTDSGLAPNSSMALPNLDCGAMDALPQAIYLCAAAGRVIRCNDKTLDLWGRTPRLGNPYEQFCGSFRLYRPDSAHLPHDQCPMAVVERPAGERRTVLVNLANSTMRIQRSDLFEVNPSRG